MSDPLLQQILAEVQKVNKRLDGEKSVKDMVLDLATKLDKHHADDVERFEQLEERVDSLEKGAA